MDKRLWLAGGAGVMALAGVALAQPQMAGQANRNADMTRQQVIDRVDARFQTLDANRDGRFTPEESRAEREARRAQRIDRMFERLDGNRDGSITRAEMAEARPMRMGGRMGGRGPGRLAGGPGGPGGPEAGSPPRGGPRGRGMRGMGGGRFGEQGFITRDQMRERALARFDRVDADRNGTVTAAERQAAREARREQRRERRQNGA